MSDWMRMINHLFSSDMPGFRQGATHSVGAWIEAAASSSENNSIGVRPEAAQSALKDMGIIVKGVEPFAVLTLANCHSRLAKIFEGERWSGGGGRSGVWAQAAARVPGAEKKNPMKFGKVTSRAVQFPLAAVLGKDEPEPSAPAPEWGADDFQ